MVEKKKITIPLMTPSSERERVWIDDVTLFLSQAVQPMTEYPLHAMYQDHP
jgi:hypothetical protein